MVEGRIDEPRNWRTLLGALAIWTLHFAAVYAGELVFPNMPAARWIAVFATFTALAALAWLWRWQGAQRSAFGALATGLAAGGVIYDALPALLV